MTRFVDDKYRSIHANGWEYIFRQCDECNSLVIERIKPGDEDGLDICIPLEALGDLIEVAKEIDRAN